jgi:hypothetical protein
VSHRVMLTTAVWFLVLGTGCPHTYRKGGKLDRAMQKDMEENFEARQREFESLGFEDDDEEERVCPDGKVEDWDCRSPPCKVTCK